MLIRFASSHASKGLVNRVKAKALFEIPVDPMLEQQTLQRFAGATDDAIAGGVFFGAWGRSSWLSIYFLDFWKPI